MPAATRLDERWQNTKPGLYSLEGPADANNKAAVVRDLGKKGGLVVLQERSEGGGHYSQF